MAYLAGAWALVQVADVIGARFDVPDVWLRMLIVVLAVGACVTLVLAWYHGQQGAQRVQKLELGMLAALLVVAIMAAFWVRPTPSAAEREGIEVAAATAAHASVAVLPFVNMSDSKENEYFADGITEEILSALGRSHSLRVISRTSVMQYKDSKKPIKQIAGELGVGAVLEGSVRRYGTKVRVTAQLIDARTDQHLWAHDYDRELLDIFAIQTDIAQQISQALHVALSQTEQSRMVAGRTGNVAAYDRYLKARTAADRARDIDAQRAAAALFHEALELDSTYALAYVGLAEVYAEMRMYTGAEWQDSAYAAARKALALAPQLAEAHASLGVMHWYAGRTKEMVPAFENALKLDPNNSSALAGMGAAASDDGDLEEALRWSLRATLVDPTDYTELTRTGTIYLRAGDYARAESWFRRSITVHPTDNHYARGTLIRSYTEQGLFDRAEAEFASYPEISVSSADYLRARIALGRGQNANAIRLFESSDRALALEIAADMRGPTPIELAYLYRQAGQRGKSERVLRAWDAFLREENAAGNGPVNEYTIARLCALRGDRGCAIEHLRKAVAGPIYKSVPVRNDVMFEGLRGDQEFQKILASVDAKGAAMRARLARIAL